MNQFERRLNKLETGTGVGAKSRMLTSSELEYIILSSNLGKPESEWITRSDISDDDFLDQSDRFPWRAGSSADAIGIHLYALREMNKRKKST